MEKKDQNIIKQTKDFWSRHKGIPLSSENALQITANIAGFFNVLAEWDATSQVGQVNKRSL